MFYKGLQKIKKPQNSTYGQVRFVFTGVLFCVIPATVMDEKILSSSLIKIAQELHSLRFLAGADGNISFKINEERIFITPSGLSKRSLKSSDLACITQKGKVLEGNPSSELLMHLTIYEKCPKAKAVLHAHPPTSIALSLSYPEMKNLPSDSLPELLLATDGIPIVPYARPSTQQMGDALLPYLPHYRSFILSRHGALTWGESLEEAFRGLERIEHSAEILYKSMILKKPSPLPEKELNALKEMRKKSKGINL